MPVTYLTDAWADAVTGALNADPKLQPELRKHTCTIAWHVDRGGTEEHVHLAVADGKAEMRLGPPEGADLNLWVTYADMASISKGELDGRRALQAKKLKADQRTIGILKYLPFFHALTRATATIDVEY